MKNSFEWRGMDGAGFQYGFYREGDKQYRLDIAVPGHGENPKDMDHKIYIDGEEAGRASSLAGAQKFLSNFFAKGLHKDLGRGAPRERRSLGDTLKAVVGIGGSKGRGGR